jgi:hypothetical protein
MNLNLDSVGEEEEDCKERYDFGYDSASSPQILKN